MPLQSIAYVSNASPSLSLRHLSGLVLDAAAYNEMASLTGVLLYDGERFLQMLEGPEDAIAPAYDRIRCAKSHSGITELGRRNGGERHFPWWSMHLVVVSRVDLRIALSSDWRGLAQRRVEDVYQVPMGLDRLVALVLTAGD
ncbi:BLUF domain-containing protein [Stenotrophomonas sp. 364]|uniref:BLUF domain-containing protein n=1 Tax=Stenotrophomonas sp. 364 TaxID=2691571 RepID=UPI00131698C0|nr:BLUF domain-containing protein [Stenotrophomonas sp. 364]QHB71789.1 F420H(2):quinone oxidoreductase [Stenotrophomonas sp. 364]